MAVLGPYVSVNMSGHNNIHSQLTKSLERILEDAYLSGELKLSGRKLREFPKPVKFDLSDTVVADLSKNRFSEVPDEVTTYVFLEKLLLSQNVIRSVPDAVGGLQSLTYLDLSSNQLTELPREVCQMPLQVLLVPDNSLTSLPKEIGKMTSLAELDASNNRLTQVPMTLGDCVGMRALDLSNNQLGLLPLQITYLRLEHLDVSCNCISSLPLELRNMNTLVTLNLDNNPLVSPPTTVCMRGRVHIFKYLENMANKDTLPHRRVEDTKRTAKHNSYINSSPNQSNHQITSGNATIDCLRHKPRHVVDSGYSTDGVDKRWSNDAGGEAGGGGGSGRSTPSTPSTLSPGAALSRAQSLSSETPLSAPLTPLLSGVRLSPDGNMSNGDDKSKFAHQQTYRQYKEALRQQRTQDIYRPRAEQPSPELDSSPQSHNSPVHSSPVNGHCNVSPSLYRSISSNSTISPNSQAPNSPLLHSTPRRFNGNEKQEENKRPVQKVVPSRINKTYPTVNGNDYARVNGTDTYVKPTSPTKSPTNTLGYNGVKSSIPRMNGDGAKLLTTSVSYVKGAAAKGPKMPWNKDAPLDKLSFTMKREFDKQKEESELLQQLRAIIESRLKMSLPEQLAPVLADGVVLCHLANHVRPRAVASVHVPSPAQPKLTMARCRRNVDNFLEACRKIGVEEEDICAPEHILCASECAPLARTLVALLAHATDIAPSLRTRERSREDQLECLEHGTDDDQMGHHFDKGTIDDQLEHRFDNVTNEDQLEHRYDKTNDDQTGHRFDNMTNDDQLEHRFDSRTSDDQARHLFGNMTNDDRLRHRFDDATNDDRRIYDPETNDYRGYVESDTNRPAYISLGSNEDRRTYERRGCVYRRRHDDRRDDYFDETDEFEAANGAYYQDRVQYVTPFYPRGVLTNEQMEIYDTDEVDFPPQMQTNDGRRYDRTKMNLDLDTNWNRACEVRDDRDRVFYTWLCLGAFMISTLVLFFYPL